MACWSRHEPIPIRAHWNGSWGNVCEELYIHCTRTQSLAALTIFEVNLDRKSILWSFNIFESKQEHNDDTYSFKMNNKYNATDLVLSVFHWMWWGSQSSQGKNYGERAKKQYKGEWNNVSERIHVSNVKEILGNVPLIASRAKYFTSISWSVDSFSRTGLTSACKALLKTSLLVLLVCTKGRYKRVQAAII